jgi:hypothetical protein
VEGTYVVAAKDLPVPDELFRGLPPHSCLKRASSGAPASQLAALLGLAGMGARVVGDGGARGRGWPEEENHLGWAAKRAGRNWHGT